MNLLHEMQRLAELAAIVIIVAGWMGGPAVARGHSSGGHYHHSAGSPHRHHNFNALIRWLIKAVAYLSNRKSTPHRALF